MTEQQIQKKIIDKYENDGWFVLKLIKTNKNGIPDLICLKSKQCEKKRKKENKKRCQ